MGLRQLMPVAVEGYTETATHCPRCDRRHVRRSAVRRALSGFLHAAQVDRLSLVLEVEAVRSDAKIDDVCPDCVILLMAESV